MSYIMHTKQTGPCTVCAYLLHHVVPIIADYFYPLQSLTKGEKLAL